MTCEICKKHASECLCPSADPIGFTFLEDGKETTIMRSRALELRSEGLAVFKEDLERYLSPVTFERQTVADLYRWVMRCLEVAPLYFWVIPSSSSGKYHPPFSQGEQGLVKHTLSVMYMANELARTFELNETGTACAVAAAAIHDMCKYGLSYDPMYFGVHECLVRVKLGPKGANLLSPMIPKQLIERILAAVESHNGSFASGSWTAFRRPPEGPISQVLHLADYTVSRKKFHYDV